MAIDADGSSWWSSPVPASNKFVIQPASTSSIMIWASSPGRIPVFGHYRMDGERPPFGLFDKCNLLRFVEREYRLESRTRKLPSRNSAKGSATRAAAVLSLYRSGTPPRQVSRMYNTPLSRRRRSGDLACPLGATWIVRRYSTKSAIGNAARFMIFRSAANPLQIQRCRGIAGDSG
jgi:hypothetical protein